MVFLSELLKVPPATEDGFAKLDHVASTPLDSGLSWLSVCARSIHGCFPLVEELLVMFQRLGIVNQVRKLSLGLFPIRLVIHKW